MKSKTTDNYLHFPEIVNNRKMISIKELEKNLINDGDILDLSNLQRKSYEKKEKEKEENNRIDLSKIFDEIEKFIDDEDKEIYGKLKNKIIEKEKEMRRKEIEKEIENQLKFIEEMKKRLNEI
jgi:hypothetical protein